MLYVAASPFFFPLHVYNLYSIFRLSIFCRIDLPERSGEDAKTKEKSNRQRQRCVCYRRILLECVHVVYVVRLINASRCMNRTGAHIKYMYFISESSLNATDRTNDSRGAEQNSRRDYWRRCSRRKWLYKLASNGTFTSLFKWICCHLRFFLNK